MKNLSAQEALKVGDMLDHLGNVIPYELGLVIDYEVGEYYIQDEKKWMLAKIKYGI